MGYFSISLERGYHGLFNAHSRQLVYNQEMERDIEAYIITYITADISQLTYN